MTILFFIDENLKKIKANDNYKRVLLIRPILLRV